MLCKNLKLITILDNSHRHVLICSSHTFGGMSLSSNSWYEMSCCCIASIAAGSQKHSRCGYLWIKYANVALSRVFFEIYTFGMDEQLILSVEGTLSWCSEKHNCLEKYFVFALTDEAFCEQVLYFALCDEPNVYICWLSGISYGSQFF